MFLMVMDMADSPKDQRKIVKLYEKYNRIGCMGENYKKS